MFNSLTEEDLSAYKTNGWVGSYAFLSAEEVNQITLAYLAKKNKFILPSSLAMLSDEKVWFKSMHAIIPEVRKVVTHPAIVEKVKSILGNDVMLWGSTITTRVPEQNHRWHVDVEHLNWPGVSVFIGLSGASPLSTLKVVSKSHCINELPPKICGSDDLVKEHAQKFMDSPEIVSVNVNEGDFFIFDGLTWHGSENLSKKVRFSIIAQYTVPSSKIEIPANFDEPITWLDSQPPCILVSGEDKYGVNKLL
jgi:non-heme Fe2+,alpha-ketoglutarate-dependent halogenase